MKKVLCILVVFQICFLTSCQKESDQFQINLNTPDSKVLFLGQALTLDVEVLNLSGGAIDNFEVELILKSTGEVIFSGPVETNINEVDGTFEYRDELLLNEALGVKLHDELEIQVATWKNGSHAKIAITKDFVIVD